MAERPTSPDDVPEPHGARADRHRIHGPAARHTGAAGVERRDDSEPFRPAPRDAPAPAAQRAVHDQTSDAIRRPAQLSERCAGCGALTRGRSGMVTELVEVGPVRGLRVVACSACPPKRRGAVDP